MTYLLHSSVFCHKSWKIHKVKVIADNNEKKAWLKECFLAQSTNQKLIKWMKWFSEQKIPFKTKTGTILPFISFSFW